MSKTDYKRRPMSAETKRKISQKRKGHKVSIEVREKIRNKLKGVPRYDLRKKKIEKECLFCKKMFYVIPARENIAKFCSKRCLVKNNIKNITKETREKISIETKKRWRVPEYRNNIIEKLRINHDPVSNLNLGYRHPKGKPTWNKGIGTTAKLANKVRSLDKYKKWRSSIFMRDNWTCQRCNIRGGYLEADHYPNRFAKIMIENNIKDIFQVEKCKELWDLNNGRTLCKKCHRLK